ncbi:MAG: hypothetical protein JWQ03_3080 [Variovorax sp.]|nr:hypothetical protein [Variovorax sp.]
MSATITEIERFDAFHRHISDMSTRFDAAGFTVESHTIHRQVLEDAENLLVRLMEPIRLGMYLIPPTSLNDVLLLASHASSDLEVLRDGLGEEADGDLKRIAIALEAMAENVSAFLSEHVQGDLPPDLTQAVKINRQRRDWRAGSIGAVA